MSMNLCACGCGQNVEKVFLPGHDQIAIHKVTSEFGGVANFLDWVDDAQTMLVAVKQEVAKHQHLTSECVLCDAYNHLFGETS